jgi:hypothetical protein
MLDTDLAVLPRLIADHAEPLPDIDDRTFGQFFDRYGEARVVLLGEASHGTSEFYRARAAISRQLIEKHGFNIVAVERDWPDAATLDRYVRQRSSRAGESRAFERFPRASNGQVAKKLIRSGSEDRFRPRYCSNQSRAGRHHNRAAAESPARHCLSPHVPIPQRESDRPLL